MSTASWVNVALLGRPVVPLVYWISASAEPAVASVDAGGDVEPEPVACAHSGSGTGN